MRRARFVLRIGGGALQTETLVSLHQGLREKGITPTYVFYKF